MYMEFEISRVTEVMRQTAGAQARRLGGEGNKVGGVTSGQVDGIAKLPF